MNSRSYITTSWDDGHPLDLRVADLLTRYGLRGTFYVPRSAENETMTGAQLRELGSTFEIGAHTLQHVALPGVGESTAWKEIAGSRAWVEDSTGRPCRMFCPPRGKFSARDLGLIRKAGFAGARTVELLSLDFPRFRDGLRILPTTLQAHPHRPPAYARNALRRGSVRTLWRVLTGGCSTDWPRLARSYLGRALARGGVFHLWGHSWEVERNGQWQRLEEVLAFLGEHARVVPALSNGEVCELGAPSSHLDRAAHPHTAALPEDSVP
jgi:hypothetical protein